MPKLYRPEEVIKVLESLGWHWVRTRGDHARLELPDGRNPVTVPLSPRQINRDLFDKITKQTGLTKRQFHTQAEEVL